MQGLLTLEPRVTSRERCARKELYVVALVVKNLPANAGDMRREFDPWVGKFPGGGSGNPLQYSCLENPMDRGAWRATVHGVMQSRTRLKRFSTCVQRCRLCAEV